jgi:hypothetical protein
LVQGLTQDGANEQRETEAKVLKWSAFHHVPIPLFFLLIVLIFSFFKQLEETDEADVEKVC